MTIPCSLERLAGRPLARMNGAGNAIVVLDLRGTDIVPSAEDARAIDATPDLRFDQLMTLHDPVLPGTLASVRIFNRDGSLSGACGNGTRCVAWFLLRDGARDVCTVSVGETRLACRREGPWRFSVDMGRPTFRWQDIPLDRAHDTQALDLGVGTTLGTAVAVGMGNPHAVFFVDEVEELDLARLGPPLETAPVFPERANISFAEVLGPDRIRLRVWERGAGATLACGSGACATLVAAAVTGRTERHAEVTLPGGPLEILWREDDHVILTGAVELEFEGTLEPAAAAEAP